MCATPCDVCDTLWCVRHLESTKCPVGGDWCCKKPFVIPWHENLCRRFIAASHCTIPPRHALSFHVPSYAERTKSLQACSSVVHSCLQINFKRNARPETGAQDSSVAYLSIANQLPCGAPATLADSCALWAGLGQVLRLWTSKPTLPRNLFVQF